MRDPARIALVLRKMEAVWGQYPDWRLGQLLINVVDSGEDDIWNLEEDRLMELLEELLNRHSAQAEIP